MRRGDAATAKRTMITCDQAERLFNPFLDGELSDSLRCEVHAHQLACPSCRRRLAILQTTAEVIARDHSEPTLNDNFTDRLMACISEGRPQTVSRRGWRIWLGSGLSAAAALGLALTAWFAQPSDQNDGVVAGLIVHDIEVFPIGSETPASGEDVGAAILVPSVGFLAESAAEAMYDGRAAFHAFSDLGHWGVSRARDSILIGVTETRTSAAPTGTLDTRHVSPLFELSELVSEPDRADEAIELI